MDLKTVTKKVGGKDYAKVLRLRRWGFLVILAIGLVWLGCNVWLVPHYDLNDYVRSFYLGGRLRDDRRWAGVSPSQRVDAPPPGDMETGPHPGDRRTQTAH